MFVDFWPEWMRNSVTIKYFHVPVNQWNEMSWDGMKEIHCWCNTTAYGGMFWIPQRYGFYYHIWIRTPHSTVQCILPHSEFTHSHFLHMLCPSSDCRVCNFFGNILIWFFSSFGISQRPTQRISLLYHHLVAPNKMNMDFFSPFIFFYILFITSCKIKSYISVGSLLQSRSKYKSIT